MRDAAVDDKMDGTMRTQKWNEMRVMEEEKVRKDQKRSEKARGDRSDEMVGENSVLF